MQKRERWNIAYCTGRGTFNQYHSISKAQTKRQDITAGHSDTSEPKSSHKRRNGLKGKGVVSTCFNTLTGIRNMVQAGDCSRHICTRMQLFDKRHTTDTENSETQRPIKGPMARCNGSSGDWMPGTLLKEATHSNTTRVRELHDYVGDEHLNVAGMITKNNERHARSESQQL